MDPVEAPLLADLHGIAPRKSERTFISTVNGEPIDGGELDAHYWWRNVREPVLFMEGLQQALQSGARIFRRNRPERDPARPCERRCRKHR